jgi:ABC-type microcin C transport system duplicated ATPase subunit YejF
VTDLTARARLLAYLQQAGLSTARAEANLDAFAHQLAERQRHHFGIAGAPIRAHCDPDCDFCQGVTSAADLIDPETQP